jgi:hypothetical protein
MTDEEELREHLYEMPDAYPDAERSWVLEPVIPPCESCGRIHTAERPVQYIRDPYIWELDGNCEMRWFCIDCEDNRRAEI